MLLPFFIRQSASIFLKPIAAAPDADAVQACASSLRAGVYLMSHAAIRRDDLSRYVYAASCIYARDMSASARRVRRSDMRHIVRARRLRL